MSRPALAGLLMLGLLAACGGPRQEGNPHVYLNSRLGQEAVVHLRADAAGDFTRIRTTDPTSIFPKRVISGKLNLVTQGGILVADKTRERFVPYASILMVEFPAAGAPPLPPPPPPRP